MAAEGNANSSLVQPEKTVLTLADYPVPVSPPPPLLSKNLELNRALTASSKSSLFSLSRNDVLFEDEWLIAVNKPQGIYCESILSSVPSLLSSDQEEQVKSQEHHLLNRLKSKVFSSGIRMELISNVELCASLSDGQVKPQEFHLSNRLDRDTSGVTVITKSHKVAAKLVKAFTDHLVKKTYLALCVGTIPKWDKVIVKSGHGRSKHGAWRVYALSDVGRKLPGGSSVRDMETIFEVLSVNGKCCFQDQEIEGENTIVVEEKVEMMSCNEKVEVLVRAYPRSGRTHQIRLHSQYLGIPIRGDVKYEGVYEWKDRKYEGHELHAESLSFEHPVTGQSVSIQAPLPLWAREALPQVSSSGKKGLPEVI